MRALLSVHYSAILFCASWFWNDCYGTLRLCNSRNSKFQNGTSVEAKLGYPISISFCVEANIQIYSYIHISHSNHNNTLYPHHQKVPLSLDVTVLREHFSAIVTIKIRKVKHEDFNSTFTVTVFTTLDNYKPTEEKLFIYFVLTPAAQGEKPEEDINYLYIIVLITIVLGVVATIVAVIIYMLRVRSRESGSSSHSLNYNQECNEEKARRDNTKNSVPSDDVHNQDPDYFISEEGLLYTTVVCTTKQGEAQTKQAKVAREENEKVEYSVLDFQKSGKIV